MPDRFAPPHFVEVGEELLAADDPDTDWGRIEDARFRSACSRAYYGFFLEAKRLLEGARRGWAFPHMDAHASLREGLATVLGENAELVMLAKRLWSYRRRSDYDLGEGDGYGVACSRLDDASRAIALIGSLSDQTLSELGYEVTRISDERRRR